MKKIYYSFVFIAIWATSCQKEKLPINTNYPFYLTSDPIPHQVYLQNGAIKIRLYINKTGNFNPTEYSFSHYILEGKGKLTDTTQTINYLVNEDYFFATSSDKLKETIYFKYLPTAVVPTEITFLVKNSQGYSDTLVYKFNIAP